MLLRELSSPAEDGEPQETPGSNICRPPFLAERCSPRPLNSHLKLSGVQGKMGQPPRAIL